MSFPGLLQILLLWTAHHSFQLLESGGVSTKWSSVCCNFVVAERGVETLCELIIQTNKSLPAIENICYVLDILTHLALFEETRSSLVTKPDVVSNSKYLSVESISDDSQPFVRVPLRIRGDLVGDRRK
ncbi:hypothetical protein QYM36_018156 [Artemia franciscana]|uniref:Uncharacterized protein n=1 Tax=Artemia franciscana TaxID=6661 RepID=A0AA88HDH6_ARTSF|nr:hypothetical protein QYM36_018691 [Artemia franciscana]KAK2703367.1 hypothetical protein QYM36_018156 [Artemia franciscana]